MSGKADVTETHERELAQRRQEMVALLKRRGIHSRSVLDAMERVPRELFVPGHLADIAYEDGALPIGEGQTISQPYIVALMTEAAGIKADSRVLEVGTGSGYSAAVMAVTGAAVLSIERNEDLAKAARQRLRTLGYDNVTVKIGDGTIGWPEKGPFDAIVVAAAGPRVPDGLRRQLVVGGRLVMPVGVAAGAQVLQVVRRVGEDDFTSRELADVAFVPLIGEYGWRR